MELNRDELTSLLTGASKSVFRLQTLPAYSVEFERDDFSAFLSGVSHPNRTDNAWLATMGRMVRSGITWTNVHVIPDRLSPYLRYIIDWWYVFYVEVGVDARFFLTSASPELSERCVADYWLVDDEVLVVMAYDSDGHVLGRRREVDVHAIGAAAMLKRDLGQVSISLPQLMASRRAGNLS